MNFRNIPTNIIKISLLLASSLLNPVTFAQENIIKIEATPEPLPSKDSIISKTSKINEKIEQTNKLETDQRHLLEHLNQIKITLLQQVETIEEAKERKEETTNNLIKLNNLDTNDAKKSIPKNFEESEKLRNEINLAKETNKKTNIRLKNARALLEQAKINLEETEKSLRELTKLLPSDLLENAKTYEIEVKEQEVAAAREILLLRRLEIELEKINIKKNSSNLKLLKKKLSIAKDLTLFSRADFQRKLSQIEESEQSLKIDQEQNKQDLDYAEKLYSEIKTKIGSPTDETSIDLERLESANDIKFSAQSRIRITTERLQRLTVTKELWESRYNNRLKNLQKEILLPLRDKAVAMLERLEREKNLLLSEIEETRKKITQTESNINNVEKNSKQRIWLKDQKTAIEKLEKSYIQNLKDIDSSIVIHQNFLSESEEQVGEHSWKQFVQEITSAISNIWNYELFSSGDYPVTVGKLILGMILLILGYFASDLLSRKLIAKLLTKFNMTQGAIAAIQALAFYLLLIAFALAALRIVNVPLTVFTVLGGALAIGVGFGSQNVMNNFISGLIILTEQPIRVGDMIEVDTFVGIVKKIGARSTIVRTGNNIDIVVPNSSFLEKNVINWTRNNSQARLSIPVGVDYNSDVELVTEVLTKSVSENNKILPSPKPFVWFTGFGESTLNFEVHFWVIVRSASEKSAIESEIRYEIFKLLKENNIVIAFPHRTLHSNKPIEIKLTGNSNV